MRVKGVVWSQGDGVVACVRMGALAILGFESVARPTGPLLFRCTMRHKKPPPPSPIHVDHDLVSSTGRRLRRLTEDKSGA